MGEASPARRVALSTLGRARRRGAYARDLLRHDMGMDALGPQARAFVTRLVLGVTATSGLLDELLDECITHPGHVEPSVRDSLRLSAFEVCFLETPAAVSVSQGVELARHASPRAAGLANAVLRRLASETRPRVDAARAAVASGSATAEQMRLASGLPAWLVARILSDIGPAAASALAASQLEPAPVWAMVNQPLNGIEWGKHLLEENGLDPEATPLPGTFLLGHPANLARSGLANSVAVVPSDLAAQLVCAIALAGKGSRLLEVGQGRATKTLVMLNLARAAGKTLAVTASDIAPRKVAHARERLAHGWKGEVIEVVCDGRNLSEPDAPGAIAAGYDTVLVDAPCSGTGTMRRHPETPWSLDEGSVDPANPHGLPCLQLEILSAAASRVDVGGTLVYSTCSVLAVEDGGVVDAFLASEAGGCFEVGPIGKTPWPSVDALVTAHVTGRGFFRTTPEAGGCDGHFCARLVRTR